MTSTKQTAAMTSLINDAMAAGYSVTESRGIVRITKPIERRFFGGSRFAGLVIDEGVAHDLSIPPDRSKAIRGYKAMRAVLGI